MVKNVSDKTVPVLTRMTGNPGYMVVTGPGCGATLDPGASCDLQIAYTRNRIHAEEAERHPPRRDHQRPGIFPV